MHPMTKIRGTSFVQNVGTSLETSHTKTAVPILRRRLSPKPTQEEIAREFNLSQEEIHSATLSARSLPFGGAGLVREYVIFANGTAITLGHRLKTARIAFELVNFRQTSLAAPIAGALAAYVPLAASGAAMVDENLITIMPLGTFTADVRFTMKP